MTLGQRTTILPLSPQQRAEDVLLLAKAYHQGRDYRRAVHTLERHGLLAVKVRGRWVSVYSWLDMSLTCHRSGRTGLARAPDPTAAAPALHSHPRQCGGLLVGPGGKLFGGTVPGGVGPVRILLYVQTETHSDKTALRHV